MASGGVLWVSVRPSLDGFGAELRRQIEASVPPEIRVRIRPDGDPAQDGAAQAGAFAAAYRTRLAAAMRDLPEIQITADSSDADRALAELRTRMAALRDLRIGVDIDAATAQARMAELEAELGRLASSSPDIRVRLDAARAEAELAAFRAELERLDGDTAHTDVDVDTSRATSSLNGLLTAGLALGPALIPIGAAVAAGLLSIGPAALTAAGAIGVLGLAFNGIGSAISAADKAQTQAGANAGQSANQQANAAAQIASAQDGIASAERSLASARAAAADGAISAAGRVQSAEQSIADAERNAAEAAVSSAQRVQSARQSVVTATENAAASVASALRSQAQAERSLADAQQAEQRAQENLTQARKDAVTALRDLKFSVEDNALNQRAASIQLQEAQAAQAALGGGATQLDRDKAQLAVDQAQQRIKELSAQGQDLATEKADADRKGVEGSQQVTAAQDAVTAAVRRTQDAQEALQLAGEAVTKAQTDGARSVAAAQQALADAQRAQANQAITSQESIAKAEQSLADARRAQARQQQTSADSIASAEQGVVSAQRSLDSALRSSAESTKSASSATDAYAEAMKKLSPAGREFVEFYNSTLKPRFKELSDVAQAGLLPGLQAGITSALPFFDQLKTIVGNIATAMGDLARDAGKALTSPFWRDFFDFMGRIAGPTIRDLGTIFGNWTQGLAGIFQALYEPVFVPIMNWFKDLSERVKNFSTSPTFQAFLAYVKDNGPVVAGLLGDFARSVGHLIEGLAGPGSVTLQVLRDLMHVISIIPPGVLATMFEVFVAIRLLNTGMAAYASLTAMFTRMGALPWATILRVVGGLAAVGLVAVAADAILPQNTPEQNEKAKKPLDSFEGYAAHDRNQLKGLADAVKDPGSALADMQKQFDDFPAKFDKSPFMTWIRGLPAMFDKFVKDTKKSFTDIGNWFANAPGAVDKWTRDNITTPMATFFKNLPGNVAKWWTDNVTKPSADFFIGLNKNVADWVRDHISTPIGSFFKGLTGNISKWWTDNVSKPTGDFFTGLGKSIGTWVNDHINKPIGDFFRGLPGTISKWWTDNVSTPSGTFFTNLGKSISTWVTDHISTPIGNFFKGLPATVSKWWTDNVSTPSSAFFTQLGKDISQWWTDKISTPLGKVAANMWTGIKQAFRDGVNGAIDVINGMTAGVNVVLRVVNVKTIDPIPHYAGGGVIPGYSPGVDSVPAMLSPGEAVLVPELVRMLGPSNILAANAKASGRPAGGNGSFAGGGVIGDITDWIGSTASNVWGGFTSTLSSAIGQVSSWVGSGVSGLIDQIKGAVAAQMPKNLVGQIGNAEVDKILNGVKDVVTAAQAALAAATGFGTGGGPAPAGQVSAWIAQALQILGYPSGYAAGIYQQIMTESGGNPNAVQHGYVDVNTLSGNLARGIMQVIPPTFAANKLPGHDDIMNPVDNIIAGSRYAMKRYGAGWFSPGPQHSHGYDEGGLLKPGLTAAFNATGKPERILTPDQNRAFERVVELAKDARAMQYGVSARPAVDAAAVSMRGVERRLDDLLKVAKKGAFSPLVQNIQDRSGDPNETARLSALARRR